MEMNEANTHELTVIEHEDYAGLPRCSNTELCNRIAIAILESAAEDHFLDPA